MRVSATIAFFIGAGLVSFSMRRGESDNDADLGIMLAFHVISLGLYFFGYVAVVRYFGFGKSFKRLFSLIPGHGGVVIEKTAGRPLLA
ncbi:hypothetical protein HDU99_002536 [Rhizoclosmatium hyalinum]|nr:hypothetical protein HDU99_002536 [Rhizoclosmatium hyalinum]